MPKDLAVSRRLQIQGGAGGAGAVAQRKPLDFMTQSCEFQGQLAEPAEAIVNEILTHVLAFAENENFHLLSAVYPMKLSFVAPKYTPSVVDKVNRGSARRQLPLRQKNGNASACEV